MQRKGVISDLNEIYELEKIIFKNEAWTRNVENGIIEH